MAAFAQGLQQQGWTIGGNLRIEFRWVTGATSDFRKHAAELVALAPDLILATGSAAVGALLQENRKVPIVFVNVIDPVGSGFVDTLAKPGGIVTGFTQFEYSTSGKWLEILKEVAPRVMRAVVLRDHTVSSGMGQFAAIQAVGPALGLEIRPVNVRSANEIERALTSLGRMSDGGIIVTASASAVRHRNLIITLAARYRLPAVYPQRLFVADGGLISYGANLHDQYRLAAGYADRIIRGENPVNLPVQVATKYETLINLKTAKALDMTIPPPLLARADEVIE